MDMRPPTDDELKQLPDITLTSDAVWDPSCLDDEFSFDEIAQDAPFDPASLDLDPRVTATGQYTGNLSDDVDLLLADCCQTCQVSHSVTMAQPDLQLLRPLLLRMDACESHQEDHCVYNSVCSCLCPPPDAKTLQVPFPCLQCPSME